MIIDDCGFNLKALGGVIKKLVCNVETLTYLNGLKALAYIKKD